MDPSSIFYVTTNSGTPVAAKFLQVNGSYVQDPNPQNVSANPKLQIYQMGTSGGLAPVSNANPNNYLIVPEDYTIQSSGSFANSISNDIANSTTAFYATAVTTMILDFKPGGSEDLQRNYDSTTWNGNSGSFVNAFTSAASWNLGFVSQQSGIGAVAAIYGGDVENQLLNSSPSRKPTSTLSTQGQAPELRCLHNLV